MKEIEIKFTYEGGIASESKLDIYDAGISIHGLARSLAITTHAFTTGGIIRKRAERARGAQIYLQPPTKGSFITSAVILFNDETVRQIGISIIGAAFWDFIKWTWSKTVGKTHIPQTPYVKRIKTDRENFSEIIAETLKPPLGEVHRPIVNDEDITIHVKRARLGDIIIFNKKTLNFISSSAPAEMEQNIPGNVTKYNILSGYGRFYDDRIARTIPFDLDESLENAKKCLLTWSMNERNRGNEGKILIDAIKQTNLNGLLERYTIVDVKYLRNK